MFIVGFMAYCGGIGWQKWRSSRVALETRLMVEEVAPENKTEALRLLDEAIKARHEERYDEGWELALRVQETDPVLAGLALLMAELAFQRRDAEAFSKYARAGALLSESAAGAKLLLALEHWRSRVAEGRSDEESGRISADMLAEAAAAQLSMDVTWFFRGALLRQIGKPAEAHHALLGSMHRQAPWRSASVIGAKIDFAQAESSALEAPTRSIGSDIGLHPADISRGPMEISAVTGPLGSDKLAKTLTVQQWQWILKDKSKQGVALMDPLAISMEPNIPYAVLPKPEPRLDYDF